MEINHITEIHRTTVERKNSPEGSLRRCWLSSWSKEEEDGGCWFSCRGNSYINVVIQQPSEAQGKILRMKRRLT
ncbi:hypothetical protein LXL04_006418 [Taraxacum kok-saghyz]